MRKLAALAVVLGATFGLGFAIQATDAPTTPQTWCRGTDLATGNEITFPCHQDPVTEVPSEATWSEVATGPGNLNDMRRRVVVSPYPDGTGVCFYLNDVFNRCDATGENEGSIFHFYPIPVLSEGDVLRAQWTDPSGTSHEAVYTVPF